MLVNEGEKWGENLHRLVPSINSITGIVDTERGKSFTLYD
jgi:hypothetical protein